MIDPNVYHRAKNRGRIVVAKDTAEGAAADAVVMTLTKFDEETGDVVTTEFRTTLARQQEIRQATNQERNRLDVMITDIQTALGVTP